MCQARLYDFLQDSDLQARLHIILLGLKCRRDYIFLARPKLAGYITFILLDQKCQARLHVLFFFFFFLLGLKYQARLHIFS